MQEAEGDRFCDDWLRTRISPAATNKWKFSILSRLRNFARLPKERGLAEVPKAIACQRAGPYLAIVERRRGEGIGWPYDSGK